MCESGQSMHGCFQLGHGWKHPQCVSAGLREFLEGLSAIIVGHEYI